MAKDLNLVGYRFNWALSIFYIVYLTVEVPSNVILKKVGPKYYIPLLVSGFGLVSLCTAFVESFAGLCTARAFLGIFEGGTMPGIAFFCKLNSHQLRFGQERGGALKWLHQSLSHFLGVNMDRYTENCPVTLLHTLSPSGKAFASWRRSNRGFHNFEAVYTSLGFPIRIH
jgi:hypothetical protein